MIYLLKLKELETGREFFVLSNTSDADCYRTFIHNSNPSDGIPYRSYMEFLRNSRYLGGVNHGKFISLSIRYSIESIRFYCSELLAEEKIIFSNEFHAISGKKHISPGLLKYLILFLFNIRRYQSDYIYKPIFSSDRYIDFIKSFVEDELNKLTKHEIKVHLKDVSNFMMRDHISPF